ncbi:MAG: S41 family peptidase [Lysobacterales bacterium]
MICYSSNARTTPMKITNYLPALTLCLLLSLGTLSNAQAPRLTDDFKDATITAAADLLTDTYVFADKGKQAASRLVELNKRGHFDRYLDLEAFADEMTRAIYAVTNDNHISVSLKPPEQTVGDPLQQWISSRMSERDYYRKNNANFKAISKIHGNVGLLDLRGFYGLAWGKDFADYAMHMLSTSDAIIIDLRNNHGGRGDMVEYLLSHFFAEPVATTKATKRQGDTYTETLSYTKALPNIRTMPDIPLFVLISSDTYSAAEGFSYPLKNYGRALFIGATTKGGANPGDLLSLNDQLNIFIPDVSVTHPTKNESWENVGIKPDVEARSGDALGIAIQMAQRAAESYRSDNDEKARRLLIHLDKTIKTYEHEPVNDAITNAYLACRANDLIFERWEINSLAHNYLNRGNHPATAAALFKANTVLYPQSSSAHANYAEALVRDGQMSAAISAFSQAVSLGEKYGDTNTQRYRDRLQTLRN